MCKLVGSSAAMQSLPCIIKDSLALPPGLPVGTLWWMPLKDKSAAASIHISSGGDERREGGEGGREGGGVEDPIPPTGGGTEK